MTVPPNADGVNQTEGNHFMFVHFMRTMRDLWCYLFLDLALILLILYKEDDQM